MPMTTRCPRCGTAFKVVADQLRVRNGLVRCGVCSHVFDGFAAIVSDQAPVGPPDAALPDRTVTRITQSEAETVRPAPYGAQVPAQPTAHVPAAPAAHVPVQPYRPPMPPAYPPHSWQSPVPAQDPEPYNQPAAEAPPSRPLLSPIDTEALRPIVPPPARPEPIARQVPAPPYSEVVSPLAPPVSHSEPVSPRVPPVSHSERVLPQAPPLSHSEPAVRQVPSSYPEPIARQVPRPPYIPPTHQTQPQPQPPRQGDGPYAVRVSDPPVFTTDPPAFTTEPAVLRGRGDTRRNEPTVPGGVQRDDEVSVDRADDQIFPVDDDDEGQDHYVPPGREAAYELVPRGRDSQGDGRYSIYVDPDLQEDEPVHMSIPGEARTRYDEAVDAGMAPPQFMDEAAQRRIVIIRRLWAYGCLAGLILLGVQWVYVYRTAIVAAVPALRPALQSACDSLGCQVGYARRIERISITASSLQPPANAGASTVEGGPSRLVLAVTLRNRYDKPQPWPALVLQLTDLSDTVVVRKVLRPQDYLQPGAPDAFAAGAEQSISVPLQVSGVQVNGYQLDKFFP